MPESPSTENASTQGSNKNPEQSHRTILQSLTPQTALTRMRMISFWVAVTLPFLYLPLLWFGFETRSEIVAFIFLIVVNFAALMIGHSYKTE